MSSFYRKKNWSNKVKEQLRENKKTAYFAVANSIVCLYINRTDNNIYYFISVHYISVNETRCKANYIFLCKMIYNEHNFVLYFILKKEFSKSVLVRSYELKYNVDGQKFVK